MQIPFNVPYMTGKELHYISEAHLSGKLAGDGRFTKLCHSRLHEITGSSALLTHSCTAALEMQALLAVIKPGDEVIMPSYTFVSTANAVALRGGVPVFVDIRQDTMNIDETLIEQAITPKAKAIMPVHYAGVACEMHTIMEIAREHSLLVLEDAAQGLMAKYKGVSLGSIGDLGALSFHETKNVISGEGGALLVNNLEFYERAEIIREKGTDRSRFFRGEKDKYTWQDIGSSFLPGEIIAAFLYAQLEDVDRLTMARRAIWQYYHDSLATLEQKNYFRRPVIPAHCEHNAHLYYILLDQRFDRADFLNYCKQKGVYCIFHYVPLHSSPAGTRFCRVSGSMSNTERLSECLVRLPLWQAMTKDVQDVVIETLFEYFSKNRGC